MKAPKICSGRIATLTCPVCQSKADICSSMATWFADSIRADEQLEAARSREAATRVVLAQLVEALDFEASAVTRSEEERYALARAREELEREP